MKSKASFTHSGYYILQFDEFFKVNFTTRMLVENATSPWGQSREWVLHRHKCIQITCDVCTSVWRDVWQN